MSTDTIAIYEPGHDFPGMSDLASVLSRGAPKHIARAVERFRERWRQQVWQIETLHDRPASLVGPGGFALRMGSPLVEIYHLLPFSRFASQLDDGKLVRAALGEFGALLHSKSVIYTHEMLAYEGMTLDEASRFIAQAIGSAAPSWEDMAESELWSPGCWIREDVPMYSRVE